MFYPVFLSVVLVVRDQAPQLRSFIETVSRSLQDKVSDYELIIVDNASLDNSIVELRALTRPDGLANLQVYALTKEVDSDTANWVGLENALGDFVAVMDPLQDSPDFLLKMLDEALSGADVVFAHNTNRAKQPWAYRACHAVFHALYRRLNGVNLAHEAPKYRLLSKRVVNFILQHPQPALTYRHLPATGGFARSCLSYTAAADAVVKKSLLESIDLGMRLLVSTTRAPMRMVTSLSLFGALANLAYAIYVVGVAIFKSDVAHGWVTLSLQQSGMFFLISLVLLVLGEYILNMSALSNEGPLYHVAQEFTSAVMTRRNKLNIEEAQALDAARDRRDA